MFCVNQWCRQLTSKLSFNHSVSSAQVVFVIHIASWPIHPEALFDLPSPLVKLCIYMIHAKTIPSLKFSNQRCRRLTSTSPVHRSYSWYMHPVIPVDMKLTHTDTLSHTHTHTTIIYYTSFMAAKTALQLATVLSIKFTAQWLCWWVLF